MELVAVELDGCDWSAGDVGNLLFDQYGVDAKPAA